MARSHSLLLAPSFVSLALVVATFASGCAPASKCPGSTASAVDAPPGPMVEDMAKASATLRQPYFAAIATSAANASSDVR